jgi:hypothetical protein
MQRLVSGQALLLGLPQQQVIASAEFMCASNPKDKFDKALTARKLIQSGVYIAVLLSWGTWPWIVRCQERVPSVLFNRPDSGYRGIWYSNQPSHDQYVYKYSGGLGTYCAKHRPFAVYRPEVEKTFFCYGGTTIDAVDDGDSKRKGSLLHMVSYYDHRTGMVPRPTILLDKQTSDAHDNPVISVDDEGYLWIFSTSHGRVRPSFIHRSRQPYSIGPFEPVPAVRLDGERSVPITNFSYMQAWHVAGQGFLCFFTRYDDPAQRTIFSMTSQDGIHWENWQRLAALEQGHYQISAVGQISAGGAARAGSAFNYHPRSRGLNWRTNLYYLETPDFGHTWQDAAGVRLEVPLRDVQNAALVYDYAAEGLNVYLKDICYDAQDRPVILYLTSRGYQAGPQNGPRTWMTARWTGQQWQIRSAFCSDNNYDMGSLWLDADGTWRILAPSETGSQPYNPGGEIALWISHDQGATWLRERQITSDSPRNHTYVRRPVGVHPDFYAFWADGHGRQPSLSQLYFANRQGQVRMLPRVMQEEYEIPPLLPSH